MNTMKAAVVHAFGHRDHVEAHGFGVLNGAY
jgi:hypothetical protein